MTSKKSNNVTDVTTKTKPETPDARQEQKAPIPDPALRSVLTDQGFAIGFAPGESVKEDGSFELSHSLMFRDAGLAVAQLESVLAHARVVHAQQVFNAGVQQGERNASQPAEAEKQAPTKATQPVSKNNTKKSKK